MKQVTQVYVVADLSGSMSGNKEEKLRAMVTEFIDVLKIGEAKGDQSFEVHLVPFSSHVEVRGPWVASAAPAYEISKLSTYSPNFGRGTALRDAIGHALERVEARKGVPALVSVFSDGEEYGSHIYSAARLEALIRKTEATGDLTLTFAGPATASRFLAGVGVPAGNFQSWDGTEQAMREVQTNTTQAVTQYVATRSTGTKSSSSFYADVSQLTTSGVRAMTKQITPKEVKKVTARMAGRSIADFYGTKFKPGNHFYELVKPEYIQDDKEIVVYIKDANEYRLGSRSVRTMLGLPETGKIRVRPAEHSAKYQLFVQSNSTNRKTVEGQTMLTVE